MCEGVFAQVTEHRNASVIRCDGALSYSVSLEFSRFDVPSGPNVDLKTLEISGAKIPCLSNNDCQAKSSVQSVGLYV